MEDPEKAENQVEAAAGLKNEMSPKPTREEGQLDHWIVGSPPSLPKILEGVCRFVQTRRVQKIKPEKLDFFLNILILAKFVAFGIISLGGCITYTLHHHPVHMYGWD